MTDNEIKQALEHCYVKGVCNGCVFRDRADCYELNLGAAALDLINRQQVEIERLKNELLESNIEIAELYKCKFSADDVAQNIIRAKSEAIKEFWQQRPPQLNPNQKGKEQYNKGWNDCISFFAEEYEVFLGVKERDVKEMVGDAE